MRQLMVLIETHRWPPSLSDNSFLCCAVCLTHNDNVGVHAYSALRLNGGSI